MKPEVIHAIIGVTLVAVGFGIIASVAYMLYGPGFSLSFITNKESATRSAQEYVCSDGIAVTVTFGDTTTVVFSGRTEHVTYTPVPEGIEVPPDAWDRYASADASFVLWKRGNTVLLQEHGAVTHGECKSSQ